MASRRIVRARRRAWCLPSARLCSLLRPPSSLTRARIDPRYDWCNRCKRLLQQSGAPAARDPLYDKRDPRYDWCNSCNRDSCNSVLQVLRETRRECRGPPLQLSRLLVELIVAAVATAASAAVFTWTCPHCGLSSCYLLFIQLIVAAVATSTCLFFILFFFEERDRGWRWGEGEALKFTAGGQRASRGNCPKKQYTKISKKYTKN